MGDRLLLDNAVLLDPEADEPRPGALWIEAGRILEVVPGRVAERAGVARRDLGGLGVAPGFLDLHYHGAFVFEGDAEAAWRQGASLVRHGTTGYLATTVATRHDALRNQIEMLVKGIEVAPAGAQPLGIHLEGPWIHGAAAGAQPMDGIRGFDALQGRELFAAASGAVRLVTLAPEVPGSDALLAQLDTLGIAASLGHTLATATMLEDAIARGARHATHLFNAMGPLHHREPGLAGVALADDRLSADLICDGAHVHPQMVAVAARALGDRLMLITDRLEPPEGDASFGAGALLDDGVALRLADGRLAGSRLTLDLALRNAIAFAKLAALDAIAACTLRPARLLGVEAQRGTLRPGARADLVLLDAGLRVRETWVGGEVAYRAPA